MRPVTPVAAPVTAPTAAPGPQTQASIRKAAEEFEAMALGQLLAPMFDTVDSSRGLFGGGDGEAAWKPMMVAEMAKAVTRAGGIGLARPVMEQMIRMQEARQAAADAKPGAAP